MVTQMAGCKVGVGIKCYRLGSPGGVPKRGCCCDPEGHLVRIGFVVAAIYERYLYIQQWVSFDDTCPHRFSNAFLDWWNVLFGERARICLVEKFEAFARFVGGDTKLDMCVVTSPSNLANIFSFSHRRPANRLYDL